MKKTEGSTGSAKKVTTPKTEKELSAIEKVRKLMEFSVENGATEAEVEAAVKAAHRLMMKHNLDSQDIEVTSKDVNTTKIESTWVDRVETRPFESRLLILLCKHFNCKKVSERNRATNKDSYNIIGLPEDRQAVVTTYNSILPQIRVLANKRFKESDRTLSEFRFTTSYQSGFLAGLDEKMEADKTGFFKVGERKQFDLMVVKKDALIDEWIGANMKIKTSKVAIPKPDDKVFAKGKEDGAEKGIGKQLGSKGSTTS